MSDIDRRQFLKGLLTRVAQAAGTAVVASAAVATARAQEDQSEPAETPPEGVRERADRLAASCDVPAGESETAPASFLNGAFRNTPLGAFRNAPLGAFRNTPLGAFRNGLGGGFRNTPLGGFGNGGWPNGVWRNWW
jgi:hypothetical protein